MKKLANWSFSRNKPNQFEIIKVALCYLPVVYEEQNGVPSVDVAYCNAIIEYLNPHRGYIAFWEIPYLGKRHLLTDFAVIPCVAVIYVFASNTFFYSSLMPFKQITLDELVCNPGGSNDVLCFAFLQGGQYLLIHTLYTP